MNWGEQLGRDKGTELIGKKLNNSEIEVKVVLRQVQWLRRKRSLDTEGTETRRGLTLRKNYSNVYS